MKHNHSHNQFSFSTNLFKLSALYLLSLAVYERQGDVIAQALITKKYYSQERIFTMGKLFTGVLMTLVA